MKRTYLAASCLLAILLAGCGQGRNDSDTGAAGGYESGAMPADTASTMPADTAALPADTAAGDTALPSDSAKANQTKSGVPSKGDTVSQTGDSAQ